MVKLLDESGLERINRAVVSGRIIPYLVGVMFLVGALGTAAVQLLSPNSFQSLGDAAWWSATTWATRGRSHGGPPAPARWTSSGPAVTSS